jgi:hypothetical protein
MGCCFGSPQCYATSGIHSDMYPRIVPALRTNQVVPQQMIYGSDPFWCVLAATPCARGVRRARSVEHQHAIQGVAEQNLSLDVPGKRLVDSWQGLATPIPEMTRRQGCRKSIIIVGACGTSRLRRPMVSQSDYIIGAKCLPDMPGLCPGVFDLCRKICVSSRCASTSILDWTVSHENMFIRNKSAIRTIEQGAVSDNPAKRDFQLS